MFPEPHRGYHITPFVGGGSACKTYSGVNSLINKNYIVSDKRLDDNPTIQKVFAYKGDALDWIDDEEIKQKIKEITCTKKEKSPRRKQKGCLDV